jgi:hypothetical protein
MTVHLCPECGQAFDGDQCWVCTSRNADIGQTFLLSLPVAFAGMIGTIIALTLYPPLKLYSLKSFYAILALLLAPIAIALVIAYLQDALTRHASLVRIVFVLVAAVFVMNATFCFLNGALDESAAFVAKGLISSKYFSDGKYGPTYTLKCTLSWSKETSEEVFYVNRGTFSAAKPGDFLQVEVHPGAFSAPWYSNLVVSNGHSAIDLGRNPQ